MTLRDAKEQIAKDTGFESWDYLVEVLRDKPDSSMIIGFMDDVAELYAKYKESEAVRLSKTGTCSNCETEEVRFVSMGMMCPQCFVEQ